MIEAVLFDYGGVLTAEGQAGSLEQEIAQYFGMEKSEVHIAELQRLWQLDEINAKTFFAELKLLYPDKKPFTKYRFLKNRHEAASRSKQLYSLAEKLRGYNIRTGILSNTVRIAGDRIQKTGGYEGFNPVILSYQARMVKPNLEIYKLAAEKIAAEPENIVFVDDDPKNLEPARKMGMFTVQAVSEQQLLIALPAILEDKNSIDINNSA